MLVIYTTTPTYKQLSQHQSVGSRQDLYVKSSQHAAYGIFEFLNYPDYVWNECNAVTLQNLEPFWKVWA